MSAYHLIFVNPVPWTAPGTAIQRGRGGKGQYVQFYASEELKTYKQAIQEQLTVQTPIESEIILTCYFWRQLTSGYVPDARKRRAHQADATNLLKACEDAIQGHLISNDRNVRDCRSVIVEQGPDVKPLVIIKIEEWTGFNWKELPENIMALVNQEPELPIDRDEMEVQF